MPPKPFFWVAFFRILRPYFYFEIKMLVLCFQKQVLAHTFMNVFIRTHSPIQLLIHIGIIALSIAVLAVSFFFIYLPGSTKHGQVVEVPNLVGLSLQEMDEKLSKIGLEMVVVDSSYSKEYQPYTVLTQYPNPKDRVKTGRKVYLTVSPKLPPQVKMPQLVGLSYMMASMKLRSMNLEVGQIKFKPDVAVDVVLSQEFNGKPITKDMLLPMGSKIDILIGNGVGEEEIEVPDLEGLSLEEAEVVLKSLDLELGVVTKDPNSKEPYQKIFRQNPPARLALADDEMFDEDGRIVKKENTEENVAQGDKDKKKKKKDPNARKNKIKAGQIIDVWISDNPQAEAPQE
jgi:beta-lactam-binding protein with PASTA domain